MIVNQFYGEKIVFCFSPTLDDMHMNGCVIIRVELIDIQI